MSSFGSSFNSSECESCSEDIGSDDLNEYFTVTAICKELQQDMNDAGAHVVNQVNDEVSIAFELDIKTLSDRVAMAWGLEIGIPVTVCIRDVSASSYNFNDSHLPSVKLWQTSPFTGLKEQFGVIPQLQMITHSFVRKEWNARRKIPFVVATEKKVQSPLQTLIIMGFKSSKAIVALKKTNQNLEQALSLLMGEKISGVTPVAQIVKDDKTKKHRDMFKYDETKGILANTKDYLKFRLSWLHEVCPLCDERHTFGTPMMKPAVCRRELCAFAFSKLGVMQDTVGGMANQSEVVDLLVAMFRAAANSTRSEFVLNPFPLIYDPTNPDVPVISHYRKHIELTKEALAGINLKHYHEARPGIGIPPIHHLSNPLLQWIVGSNRSHLIRLEEGQQLKCMDTKYQYMLLSAPPEVEEAFSIEKEKKGSVWAFHGSRTENWHCILRSGLRNMSGTKGQLNGAAYGPGVYVSPAASLSMGYSTMFNIGAAAPKNRGGSEDKGLDESGFNCMAICEIIKGAEKRHNASVWTVVDDTKIVTRFFIVIPPGQVCSSTLSSVMSTSDSFLKEIENIQGNVK